MEHIAYKVTKNMEPRNFGKTLLGEMPDGNGTSPIFVKWIPLNGNAGARSEELILFNKKLSTLTKLNHQNVMRYITGQLVHTEDDEEQSYYEIIMEYFPAGTILTAINRRISGAVLQNWTKQLVCALDYLASQRIVHGDLNPTNIFLDSVEVERTFLKIGGFFKHGQTGGRRWIPEDWIRASCFAPEQIRCFQDGSVVTCRSDIWSLGCVMLHVITGESPKYHQTNPKTNEEDVIKQLVPIMNCIARGGIPTIPESLHHDLDGFIRSCLKPRLEDRPIAAELLTYHFLNMDGKTIALPARISPGIVMVASQTNVK